MSSNLTIFQKNANSHLCRNFGSEFVDYLPDDCLDFLVVLSDFTIVLKCSNDKIIKCVYENIVNGLIQDNVTENVIHKLQDIIVLEGWKSNMNFNLLKISLEISEFDAFDRNNMSIMYNFHNQPISNALFKNSLSELKHNNNLQNLEQFKEFKSQFLKTINQEKFQSRLNDEYENVLNSQNSFKNQAIQIEADRFLSDIEKLIIDKNTKLPMILKKNHSI